MKMNHFPSLPPVFVVCLLASSLFAQTTAIRAGRLIDGQSDKVLEDVTVLVDNNKILSIGKDLAVPANATVIDLRDKTVLPGLIDVHTHIMSVGGEDYGAELYKSSIPFRTLCAVASARKALWRGFTAMRDVESEGTLYADADLKKAIDGGIVPGPRLWVSTRGLSVPGRYYPEDYSWELDLPKGVQMVSGVEECLRAVREQAANGADWIKFYADWQPYRITDDGKISALPNFTQDELTVMVREAHRLDRKVAVHAMGHEGVREGSGYELTIYDYVFLRSEDLDAVSKSDRAIVTAHILSRLEDKEWYKAKQVLDGLEHYLSEVELNEMVRGLISRMVGPRWNLARDIVKDLHERVEQKRKETIVAMVERVRELIEGNPKLQELKTRLEDLASSLSVPF